DQVAGAIAAAVLLDRAQRIDPFECFRRVEIADRAHCRLPSDVVLSCIWRCAQPSLIATHMPVLLPCGQAPKSLICLELRRRCDRVVAVDPAPAKCARPVSRRPGSEQTLGDRPWTAQLVGNAMMVRPRTRPFTTASISDGSSSNGRTLAIALKWRGFRSPARRCQMRERNAGSLSELTPISRTPR